MSSVFVNLIDVPDVVLVNVTLTLFVPKKAAEFQKTLKFAGREGVQTGHILNT